MDRRFKERLIGAVVLACAAVFILPAVLNGPHAPLPEPTEPGETAVRTEPIELDRAPEGRYDTTAAPASAAPAADPAGTESPDASQPAPTPSTSTGAAQKDSGQATDTTAASRAASEPAPAVSTPSPAA